MSLSSTLAVAINDTINTFISNIASKYNLDESEIKAMWDNNTKHSETKKKDTPVITKKETQNNPEHSQILKASKAELIAMCKTYGHKCSGTKEALIARLLGKSDEKSSSPSEEKTQTKKAETKAPSQQSTIIKKLTANIPDILIKRNKFNNYEHAETGLIFDNNTKIVIGKQKSDGSIEELTEEDIDKCNAYKFVYKLPKNLDHKATLADVKVAELDEEENENETEAEASASKREDDEEQLGEDDFEEEELLEEEEEFEEDD